MLRDPMSNSAATTAAVSAPTFQLAFSLGCPRPAAGSLPLARSAWPQLSLGGDLVPSPGPWGFRFGDLSFGDLSFGDVTLGDLTLGDLSFGDRDPWGPDPWGPGS